VEEYDEQAEYARQDCELGGDLTPLRARRFLEIAPEEPFRYFMDWLRPGTLSLVFAPGGKGKSVFAIDLLDSLHCGVQFLGRDISAVIQESLLVDGEMPLWLIKKRLHGKSPEMIDGLGIITKETHTGLDLVTGEGQNEFLEMLKQWLPQIVVFDNKVTLWPMEDENAVAEWAAVMDFLSRVRALGIAVILIHHANKSGGARGSSAALDLCDTAIELKSEDDGIMSVHFPKHRLGSTPMPIEFEIENDVMGLRLVAR
jgi:putative DNA primase/helicase